MAGPIGLFDEKAFGDLLFMDTLRGKHSTGVCSVSAQHDVKTLKKAMPAADFMDLGQYATIMRRQHRVLIGHNRYATAGAVNSVNAHPFTHGAITGVHNGTLVHGWKNLLEEGNKFSVDSEAVIYNIATQGIQKTIPLLNGAFALVWYDEVEGSLNICRNDERELFYCFTEGGTLMWASEFYMLAAAMDRRDIAHNKICLIKPLHHYRFDIENAATSIASSVAKPSVRGVTEYVAPKRLTPAPTKNTTGAGRVGGQALLLQKLGFTAHSDIQFYTLQSKDQDKNWIRAISIDNDFDVRIFIPGGKRGEAKRKEIIEFGGWYTCDSLTGSIPAALAPGEKDVVTLYCDNLVPKDDWNEIGVGSSGDPVPVEGELILAGEEADGNVLQLPTPFTVVDHRGAPLTEREFRNRYKGCAWCSDPLVYGEITEERGSGVSIYDVNDALCPDCSQSDEVAKHINAI